MKPTWPILCLLVPFLAAQTPEPAETNALSPPEPPGLPAPGQAITLTFPDLPPTLQMMDGDNPGPVTVMVRLPDNYSPDRTYPLFVFLEGGDGGNGYNLRRPLQISRGTDYIAVNLPLFRKAPSDYEEASRFGIGFDDFPTISHAYSVILDRIRETIPNIDAQSSLIGGHSNGAKTIAVLLSGLDENMLQSFRGFFMIDGGFEWSSYGRTKTLQKKHILMIAGDDEPNPPWWRGYSLSRMAHFKEVATRYGMTNWKFVVAEGHGHGFSFDYFPIIREWLPAVGDN